MGLRGSTLSFGPATDFPSVGDAEDSELVAVIKAILDVRRQGSLFESPDLMARTGWFVPGDEAPPHSGLGTEDPESEAGGSSAPSPGVGGTSRAYAFALSRFSLYYAYRLRSNLSLFPSHFQIP